MLQAANGSSCSSYCAQQPHSMAHIEWGDYSRQSTFQIVQFSLTALVLVIFAGLMAGCTLALTSIDEDELLANNAKAEEGDQAAMFVKQNLGHPWIRQRKHWLMVTLMLCNAGANEALPIVLHFLFTPEVSIAISVTCVLLFGEIIPSAIMTGPKQLSIAAHVAPFVRILMLLTGIVSSPAAKALDCMLGIDSSHDGDFRSYDRKHLMLKLQKQLDRTAMLDSSESATTEEQSSHYVSLASDLSSHNPTSSVMQFKRTPSEVFHEQEWNLLQNLPTLASKTVEDLLHPHNRWDQVHKVEENDVMSQEWMVMVRQWGHSRLPVVASEIETENEANSISVGGSGSSYPMREEGKGKGKGKQVLDGIVGSMAQRDTTASAMARSSSDLPPIGFLYLRDLLHVNPADRLTLREHDNAVSLLCPEPVSLCIGSECPEKRLGVIRPPLVVSVDTPVLDMLHLFKSGAAHIALVTRTAEEVQAASVMCRFRGGSRGQAVRGNEDVALLDKEKAAEAQSQEDVMEELVGEIYDETDTDAVVHLTTGYEPFIHPYPHPRMSPEGRYELSPESSSHPWPEQRGYESIDSSPRMSPREFVALKDMPRPSGGENMKQKPKPTKPKPFGVRNHLASKHSERKKAKLPPLPSPSSPLELGICDYGSDFL